MQILGEVRGIEPGGKRASQPAGPEHPGAAVGHQVTERNEPEHPPLHLPGVGLDRQVDVVAGVVDAYGDRAALDVEPAFGSTRAGQPQVQDDALLRQFRRDRALVQAPEERLRGDVRP